MSNLFSDDFNGCGELVLELFKGTYDFHEFVPVWIDFCERQKLKFSHSLQKTE